ncbi:FAD-dependent oxidoreductase [Haloarchaeobius salinus]|uniref:FAD-dependent oxidoreductase n=1 Tax=Haloarchaeobius salinus TaxID=1198298 RepID=UPI002108F7F4|nr:FAD-dependent oxidoreductase [Haloarchaeobius salinus]
MMGDTPDPVEHDVVVVGGGPAGCSAGVFLARSGADTAIYDRGRSSLARCAHLENYPGFPMGIDVETFYDLLHGQAENAGCELVGDMVESVERRDDGVGFVVAPQEGDPVTARRVVAATRYDGEYMRGLDDDGAMFRTYEHDGEEHESFDPDYPDTDGTTPVEGLYVVTPASPRDKQVAMAVGRGARVARRVVADRRIADGWWEAIAANVDWVRREAELDDEWADRERWETYFDEQFGPDAPYELDSEAYERVRGEALDQREAAYIDTDEVESRRMGGHEAVAAHLDAGAVVAAHDEHDLLDAMDAAVVEAYLDDGRVTEVGD